MQLKQDFGKYNSIKSVMQIWIEKSLTNDKTSVEQVALAFCLVNDGQVLRKGRIEIYISYLIFFYV